MTRTIQRRTFISLPKLPGLPNLLKPLSTSREYKERKLVSYSQQEFYDLVANVDDYQHFLPWCTHSKMSEPLPEESVKDTIEGSTVTVRHGELGIGFNSLQERYVSNVTCQEPWTVRAVSYDSKLFKELATIWKFTPNVPKTSTLESIMDHELQERQLLTRPTAEEPSISLSLPPPSPKQPEQPTFTAAAVFGAAAVPKLRTGAPLTTVNSSPPSTEPRMSMGQQHRQKPLPTPLKQTVQRTSSPSSLAMMKPSDYPSCWVDFEIQFEFASPVHASMSSLFFDQVSKEMLEAFIKRAETLYGQRSSNSSNKP
ncbi:Coenzyme Q-binding protein coq10a, mitochondrial [Mortierella claussenii]|nr:Coenzyme Q-binding protein coq10a, mitochondrial [Mortierella claussenii]